ncbi:MAG: hypothetical protein CM1200mP2_54840 [Planctomycetaceae bacterium]|nr:MAG: hypothetical protein CM1200mP2_54840 [Planctomycetaceae bacterium]
MYITPVSQAFTDVPPDSTNRLLKWAAFQRRGVKNFHGRPIDGLIAVVDMDRRAIFKVIDTGAVPIPDGPVDFDERSVGKLRKRGPGPLRVVQPRGPGFRVSGHEVTWQNWHFPLFALILAWDRSCPRSPTGMAANPDPSFTRAISRNCSFRIWIPPWGGGTERTWISARRLADWRRRWNPAWIAPPTPGCLTPALMDGQGIPKRVHPGCRTV